MLNRLKNCQCTKFKGIDCNWVVLRNSFTVNILSGLDRILLLGLIKCIIFLFGVSVGQSVYSVKECVERHDCGGRGEGKGVFRACGGGGGGCLCADVGNNHQKVLFGLV